MIVTVGSTGREVTVTFMIGVEVGRGKVMVGVEGRSDVDVGRAVPVGLTAVTTPREGVFVPMGTTRVGVWRAVGTWVGARVGVVDAAAAWGVAVGST